MPYASGCLHNVDDHEQLGPSSRSGGPQNADLSPREGVSVQHLTRVYPPVPPGAGHLRRKRPGVQQLGAGMLVCSPARCEFTITVSVLVQFRLVMHYLSEMSEEQTLVMYSGHPMGLFPSLPSSPRAIITNGMVTDQNAPSTCILVSLENTFHPCRFPQVIPNYSSRTQYEKMFALGVSV